MAIRRREAVPEGGSFLDDLAEWRAVREVRRMLIATDPPHPLGPALDAEAERLHALGLGWGGQLDGLLAWCDAHGLGYAARATAARAMGRVR